jgi:hypothetical protein
MSEQKGQDKKECDNFYISPDGDCTIQTDWEDIQDTGVLKQSEWRFLVLNLGPPGAGKSSSIEEIKKYTRTLLPSSKRRNLWTTLNHDVFVSNDPRYNEAIEQYESVNKRLRKDKKEARDNILNEYNMIRTGRENKQASDKFITDLWNGVIDFDPNSKEGLDYVVQFGTRILLYKSLINAIIDNKDIIYEAKGSKWTTILNIFNMIQRHNCSPKSPKYIIIVSYNDTTSAHTMQNISVRWQQSLEQYRSIKTGKETTNSPDFELPKPWNLGDKKQNLEDITNIKNKMQQLSTCYNEDNGKGEGVGIGPDILVIFDKTKKIKSPFIIPLSVRGTILYYRVRLKTKSMHRASLKLGKMAISSLYKRARGEKNKKINKKHFKKRKHTNKKGLFKKYKTKKRHVKKHHH